MFISVVTGIFTGNIDEVTTAAITMSKTAVEIAFGLIGIMALWLGTMKIAEESGLIQFLSRGLQPIGQSMLVETPASGPAVVANPFENGFGSLVQGALESSNVNVVQELVDMIETQRAYEVNSKAISGVDDMLRFISQNL